MNLMVGSSVNAGAVVIGSVFGAYLGDRISESIRIKLPLVFGCCSMSLDVVMLGKVHTLPPVIRAILAVPLLLVQGVLFFGAPFVMPLKHLR